jgi:hypothetical protein
MPIEAPTQVRFNLPSSIALERYLTTFFDSFIIHVPCLHAYTWRADMAHPSMLLGMTAIGANYQFEKDVAYYLNRIARLSILDYVSIANNADKHAAYFLNLDGVICI